MLLRGNLSKIKNISFWLSKMPAKPEALHLAFLNYLKLKILIKDLQICLITKGDFTRASNKCPMKETTDVNSNRLSTKFRDISLNNKFAFKRLTILTAQKFFNTKKCLKLEIPRKILLKLIISLNIIRKNF